MQVEGYWPDEHPLPLPVWAPKSKTPYKLQCVWEYEELASNIELHVQKLLEEFNYDTVGNFVAMCRAFKQSSDASFHEFFQT